MEGTREKKKRGCCGAFLWILIILVAIVVGGYFLVKNRILQEAFRKSEENIAKALVLDGFDFDMDITKNETLDPDFKDMMDSYEKLYGAYADYATSKELFGFVRNYIKMHRLASGLNKKIERVKGIELTATEYYYMLEVESRIADYAYEKKKEKDKNISTESN